MTATFTISAGADDGDIQSRSPAANGWPPTGTPSPYTAGTVFTAGKRNAFGDYCVLVGLLRFDTSSLPDDAQIASATLRLYPTAKTDADGRSLIGSWYDPSRWPLTASD